MLWEYGLLLNWGEIVRVNVYCPICGRAGIKRKLLEVDVMQKGKFIHGARRTKKMWRLNYQ